MSSYLSVMIKENVKLMNMKKDVTDVEMRRIMEKFGKVIGKTQNSNSYSEFPASHSICNRIL